MIQIKKEEKYMSLNWYPVINEAKCILCGACIQKCRHGVYDSFSEMPHVIHPENCIEGCHGCQNKCKSDAITYFGDSKKQASCGCEHDNEQTNKTLESCGCSEVVDCGCQTEPTCCSSSANQNQLNIDFLYLDLSICSRCQATETTLEQSLDEIKILLSSVGYEVTLNKIHIDSLEKAIEYSFISSPTIRLNGIGIVSKTLESNCKDCGDLCGSDVDCRDWIFEGVRYTEPPKQMMIKAILLAIYGPKMKTINRSAYEVPQNIIRFFESKKSK